MPTSQRHARAKRGTGVLLRATALVVLLVGLVPLGVLAADPIASGHAQVVAQGSAPMPADEVVWRVREPDAEAGAVARPEPSALGFVVALDTPLVVATGDDLPVRLLPGEARFTAAGASERRASVGPEPVTYLALELQPAAGVGSTSDELFRGTPFAAPDGAAFDVDLVRDVLQRGEATLIPAGAAPTLIHVTDGVVSVEPPGASRVALAAGDSLEVAGPGTVEVRGGSRAPAAFVAAVVAGPAPELPALAPPVGTAAAATATKPATGGAVTTTKPATGTTAVPATTSTPKPGATAAPSPTATAKPSPAATGTPAPTATATPAATATPTPDQGGVVPPLEGRRSISVTVRACPEGTTAETVTTACKEPASGVPFVLGGALERGTVTDDQGRVRFRGISAPLPRLRAALPGEEATSWVSCSDGSKMERATRVGPNTYELDVARADLDCVWFLVPTTGNGGNGGNGGAAGRGVVAVSTRACPSGMRPGTFDPAACRPLDRSIPLQLAQGRMAPLTPVRTTVSEATWTDLPRGRYDLTIGPLPDPYASAVVVGDATQVADGVFAVEVGRGDRVEVAVYLFPEANGPGPAAAEGAALTVVALACPQGSTPQRFSPETCAPVERSVALQLSRGRTAPIEPVRTTVHQTTWTGLPRGRYDLTVGPLPDPYGSARLMGDATPVADGVFTVDLGRRDETLTLYLFPQANGPDVTGPGQGTDQGAEAGSSLTLLVAACPQGTTPNRFLPEMCQPFERTISLQLTRGRMAPVEPDIAGPGIVAWSGLPDGAYTLMVGPLPDPFATSALEGVPCCTSPGGFDLSVRGDDTLTLYLFPEANGPGPQPRPAVDTPDAGAAETPVAADETSDSDRDGLSDAAEAAGGTDPRDPDTDGDGLLDGFEAAQAVGSVDTDQDGLTDAAEAEVGTLPTDPDTDHDGLLDGAEGTIFPTDPLSPDTDGDGVTDGSEAMPTDGAALPSGPWTEDVVVVDNGGGAVEAGSPDGAGSGGWDGSEPVYPSEGSSGGGWEAGADGAIVDEVGAGGWDAGVESTFVEDGATGGWDGGYAPGPIDEPALPPADDWASPDTQSGDGVQVMPDPASVPGEDW